MRRSGGKVQQKQPTTLSPTGAVSDTVSPTHPAASSSAVSPSGRFLLRAAGVSPRKRTQRLPRASPNSPPAFLSPSSPVHSPLNSSGLESSFLTSDELDYAASEWIQSAAAVSPPPIQLSSPVPYTANQHVSPLAKQAATASALSETQHKLSVLTELHAQQSEQVTKLEQQRSQLEARCRQLEVEVKLTSQEKTMLLGTANRHAQQLATAHAELDAATARERALEEVNENDAQALQQLQTKLNEVNIQFLQQRTESERLAASYVSSMRQLELSHQNDIRVAKNEGREAARKEFEKLLLEREQAWENSEKERELREQQKEAERQQELELKENEVFEKPAANSRQPSVESHESALVDEPVAVTAAHDAEVAQAQLQAILDEQAKTAEAHAMAAEMRAKHEELVAQMAADHAALQKMFTDLQLSQAALESTVRALYEEKEELEASLELHNETAKVMEDEHNSMTKQLQESQRRLTQLETDEAALRLSLESETRSSAESQAKSVQLERENKQMEQSLRKVMADSELQREAERAATVEWNRQKADLTKELAQAQIKVTKLQQKLTAANQGVVANASGMEKHTKQLQELQQLHDSTDAAYQAAKAKLAKSAAREQKLQEERTELVKKLDTHARDRKALEGQVNSANQSLAAATKASESKSESLKNVKEQLKQESESAQAKLKVATEMTIAADAKARAAQSLLEKKEVEIIALQDRVAKLEVVVAKAEAAKLPQSQESEAVVAAETSIEDEKKLADDSKSPDSASSPSKSPPSAARTELDIIRGEHAELSAQHQQLQEEFDTVQQEVASLLTQRDELQSVNKDLLDQLNTQQASIDDARQTTIHAVQHMQLRNGEIDALSAEHRREVESMNLSHQVIINQLQHQLITSHQKALRAEMNFSPISQRSTSHLPVEGLLSPIPMISDEELLSPSKSVDTSVRASSCEHSCPVHASRSDRYELLSMLESQSLTMEQLLNEKQQILEANSGDAATIVAQLHQQLAQQQQKVQDLERELLQAQTLLTVSTAAAARSSASATSEEIAALQKLNEELESSLEQLTRRLNATETQSDALAQESLRQINELEEDLKRVKAEARASHESEREQFTAAEAESRASEIASTLEAASRRSNSELVALQELHAQELTKLRLNMSKLEQDHQRLKLSSDQLTHRNSDLESENKERLLHVCQLTSSLDQLNHTVTTLKSGTVLVENDAKIAELANENAAQKEQIAQLVIRIQQQQQSAPLRLQQLEQTVLELQGTVAESEKLLDAAQRQQQNDALAAAASSTRLSTVEGELSRSEQSLAAAIDARLFAEQRLSQLELQLKLQNDRFEVEKKQWDTTKAMVESEIVLEHINPDGSGIVESPSSPQHQQAIAMLEATIQQSGAAYQVAQANQMRQQEVHEKQLKELQTHHREQLERIEQQHLLVRQQFETEIDSLRRQLREKQLSVDEQLFTQQQQHGDELNALVEKHTQAMHELEDQSNQLLHELTNKESELNVARSDLTSERLARTALQASSAASTHLHSELSNASASAVEQHKKEREMLMELIKVQEQVIEESKDEHETRNGNHAAPLSSAIVPLLAQLQSKADLSRDLQHQLFLATSNVERLELYVSGLEQQIRGTTQGVSLVESSRSSPSATSTWSSNSLNETQLAPTPMALSNSTGAAFTPVLPVSLTSVLTDSSINPTASIESVSRPTYLSSMLQALHEEQRATPTAKSL